LGGTYPDRPASSPDVNLYIQQNKDAMRKTLLTGLILAGFAMLLNTELQAQTPWLSKDVQKIANKKEFATEKSNYHITAVSMDQSWVVSKGVSNLGRTETQSAGNIQSHGIPQWTISKGVHKINTKQPVNKEQEDYRPSPAITGEK
jgi:hypothetical protein